MTDSQQEPRIVGYNIKAQIEAKDGTEGWKQQFENYTEVADWLNWNESYEIVATEKNEVWS